MRITIRHYNVTANNVIKKLTRHNKSFVNMLSYNATAYCLEQHLFKRGKFDVVYINEKDLIPTAAQATHEMIKTILETDNLFIASITLDIAEFCTELCNEFLRK